MIPWIVVSLGLIVGSFLNVVIVRLPRSISVVRPGSSCPECSASLRWWQNIPLLSYLLLRGKCAECKAPISIRYPVVELLTAVLFYAASVRFGAGLAAASHGLSLESAFLWVRVLPFLALLIAMTFIDLEHRIIPDQLSLGGLVLGLLTSFLDPNFTVMDSFSGALLGFSLFFALAWGYQKFRGQMGLGGGDIKLIAMLGSFVGTQGVLFTICFSSMFGSIVGLLWAFAAKKSGKDMMQFAIPFGPFLVVGALVYYFLGDVLWFLFMSPT